jgi:SPP1 family predicted phage head-tail adaptor
MKAGKLRHRATLQQNTPTQNAAGQFLPSWTNVLGGSNQVWCEVLPASGREFEKYRQMVAELTHTVRMRYMPNALPTEKMRFLYGSRVLNIQSAVNVDERNKEMICLCVETK